MKITIIVLAILTLAACGRFGGKAEKAPAKTEKTEMMAGAYGQQRPLQAKELELFRKVTAGLDGVGYTPQTVATQVVAGRNYRFICIAVTATREPQTYQAEITVFQPLPGKGEPKITSIKRL